MKRFQMPSLGLPRPQRLKANSALLRLPAAEFLLWIKGRGSDPVTSAAKHDINRDLRAWPIAVKGERQKCIMRRGFGGKGWSGEVLTAPWLFRATWRVCPEVPHTVCFLTFPGNSLSLLNSLMNLFLFGLKGVDIPVTEPNFFNMKILTRSRLWGKRMLYAFSLINQQQPKRQKQTHEQKNLCSLLQIILSLWKMNEIRNTPVHIIYTQGPLRAGTLRSFWTGRGFLLYNCCEDGEENLWEMLLRKSMRNVTYVSTAIE